MLLLLAVLFVVAITLINRSPEVSAISYSDTLEQTISRAAKLPDDGENGQASVSARFRDLWGDLTVEGIDRMIGQVYAEDVWFNDTIKTVTGRDALKEYLHETATRVARCRVEVDDIAFSGGNYYVRWRMTVVPHDASESDAWRSTGMTHLRFNADGQVLMHQDYWDAASGLYEHLPVFGWMMRNIKARL